MMPQLQKGKSRTLQIYCIDFSLLKLSPPAIRRHYTTTFVPLSLSLDHTTHRMDNFAQDPHFLQLFLS
uniref:hypothetical protein n=1 Tax=Klebsiella pneumoniae TaxID=573 RepID=UPI001D0D90F4